VGEAQSGGAGDPVIVVDREAPSLNEYGSLQRVLLRGPLQACASQADADAQWRSLNFSAAPLLDLAARQYSAFRDVLSAAGAVIHECASDDGLTLDAVYVRDASIVTAHGAILCRMGKRTRESEPSSQRRAFAALGIPVLGAVEPPGCIEGGDVVWFDASTVAVGRGYRTNDAGIAQLRALLDPAVSLIVVPMPHHRGPADVFHLMSIISPVDRDLAVVYSPLMPVPFREWLVERGVALVEVPDQEFDSMGANVLAVAPRQCVMLDGNPITRARLEHAGAAVSVYDGSEISVKGGGGPTCLTRPIARL
jgi:N-dimethylarginine dimethylaminohydrolase